MSALSLLKAIAVVLFSSLTPERPSTIRRSRKMGEGEIQGLPEGCISHIISLTSPADACRLAAVSPIFRSAADSDTVWERFLPPDHLEIVSQADQRVEYSSMKELFFRLCDSILIDCGRKSFAVERSSGKKCFLLSARDLMIIWGHSPNYWQWISVPESRFPEVAHLRNVCWLEIRGQMDSRMLSEKTRYAVNLLFRITENSNGLGFPQQALIKNRIFTSERTICLHPDEAQRRQPSPPEDDDPPPPSEHVQDPCERDDGWMEIEIGQFFCDDGGEGEVDFSVLETRGGHWKRGLLIEGIQLRPAA